MTTVSWVEEWNPATQSWVRISDDMAAHEAQSWIAAAPVEIEESAARFAVPIAHGTDFGATPQGAIASYGPFVVIDGQRAAMIGSTNGASPAAFDAMLRDFPGLRVLELVEAPGTSNDLANLAVGRRIRAAGIRTHVPRGGSVRSGAVELFLAGAERSFEDGAQFAVHSWLDNYGREPDDFSPDAPANRLYLDYYVEMGMSRERAEDFYAMTNSVPHHSARWFGAEEMRFWLRPETAPAPDMPVVHLAAVRSDEPLAIAALDEEPIVLAHLSLDLALRLPHLAMPMHPRIAIEPTLRLGEGASLALVRATDAA
ncbi:MAG: alpha/beta hydrolase [Erythrobacter sp.]|nr:alpha/beta hydrolase [Erythrobacter sp.]